MKIGVIVPSKLQKRPGGLVVDGCGPELWLDRALASVRKQIGYGADWQIFVGVDPGAVVPAHIYDHARVVTALHPGHVPAVNAAAAMASLSSEVLLFLDDDDAWLPSKTVIQVAHLQKAPFVSCSSRSVSDETYRQIDVLDYPYPSSWMMEAKAWNHVGGLGVKFKWLSDMDFLGKLQRAGIKRAHLVVKGSGHVSNALSCVSRFSEIVPCLRPKEFLVDKTFNKHGITQTCQGDISLRAESDDEAATIRDKFGFNPW